MVSGCCCAAGRARTVGESSDLYLVVVAELARGQGALVRPVEGVGGAEVEVFLRVTESGEACLGVVVVRVRAAGQQDRRVGPLYDREAECRERGPQRVDVLSELEQRDAEDDAQVLLGDAAVAGGEYPGVASAAVPWRAGGRSGSRGGGRRTACPT